ncbi:penicillin-binding protein activator LpoB [Rahnella aquatilis]|uniref:Penicillin-binding protein activator LpoB n=1 Tax=Rahnella aquatilis (strain ATCC 33071 / DSM 4594 / JCM 1683 / NBRC 105701 / NCIMB 13365 / CIP 78.65) TaxID=745277 RepID=H2IU68_RAHAC|nr:penicillin-binding protein activator LpoB [Rahnella aquatilis]AEX52792.1 putative lipoprotein [Rahnella aquatilis CIP 78.65 = ATCC 33071]KFD05347.1 YcfM family salvage pathway lipoprotein [Rahnella aquatilis CIP 78.65 = ATCC 33071]
MKKYFLIVAMAALILGGCTLPNQQQPQPQQPEQPQQPQQPLPPVNPPVPEQPQVQPVPQPPKFANIDWTATVEPMLAKMLKSGGVQPGSVLLVDGVKNSTNGSLQMAKATDALRNALANNTTFQVVPAGQLASAKQSLGLSPDDSLASVSKAIGLANIVKAQYVLYSTVSGDVKAPTMSMRLLTAPSGEIVWSGRGAVQN